MSSKYNYYTQLLEKGLIDDNKFYDLSMAEYNQPTNDFTLEQVDDLEKRMKTYGIDFERNLEDDEVKIAGVLNQLASGVVEGFTTIGWADDPSNQAEAMFNKIGHLLGFAPDIIAGVLSFGATLPGSVAKKSAFRAARLKYAENVQKGLGKIAEKPFMMSRKNKAGDLQLRSVPMRAADWVIDNGKKALGGEEFLRNNFIGRKLAMHPEFKEVLEESAHLGIAMAVSAREEGPEGMLDAAKHGVMAGAFFGSVRNYVNIGQKLASLNKAETEVGKSMLKGKAKDFVSVISKKGGIDMDKAAYIDFAVRGGAGSAFTGLQATYQGAPTADQVYEYALGFFFGAGGRPAHEARGTKAIIEHMNGKLGDKDAIFNVKETLEVVNKDYKEAEWYKTMRKEDKKAADYVDAFVADHIATRINSMGENVPKVLMEAIREVLVEKGVKDVDVLSERDKIDAYMNASDKVIKDLVSKNAELVEAYRKDAEARPDTDLSKVKEGDSIVVYNEKGSMVKVEVQSIKEGKIEILEKETGRQEILEEGSYTSKNPLNPNYTIPAYEWLPEAFHGKKVSELTNAEKNTLAAAADSAAKSTLTKKDSILKSETILANTELLKRVLRHIDMGDKLVTETTKPSKNELELEKLQQEIDNFKKDNPNAARDLIKKSNDVVDRYERGEITKEEMKSHPDFHGNTNPKTMSELNKKYRKLIEMGVERGNLQDKINVEKDPNYKFKQQISFLQGQIDAYVMTVINDLTPKIKEIDQAIKDKVSYKGWKTQKKKKEVRANWVKKLAKKKKELKEYQDLIQKERDKFVEVEVKKPNQSEQVAKDTITKPEDFVGPEKPVGEEVDRIQSERIDVDTTTNEIINNVKNNFPDLNLDISEARVGLKKIAQESRNIEEFKEAALDYIIGKRKVEGDKDVFTPQELNKLYFDYGAVKERHSLTAVKDEKGNWTLIETPRTDGNNNGLLQTREESYHNSIYDTQIDRKIQYYQLSNKPDTFIKSTRDELGFFANEKKGNWAAINGELVKMGTEEYISHINNSGSSNMLNIRKLAFSKDINQPNYLPDAIRIPLLEWASKKANQEWKYDGSEVKKPYRQEMEARGRTKEEQIERFHEEFLSNVIYELQDAGMLPRSSDGSLSGLGIQQVNKAYNRYLKEGSFPDLIKWFSYRKSFETGRPLEGDYTPFIRTNEAGIRTMIISDAEGLFGVSDGQKYYSKELRETILKETGRDIGEGYIKDVILKEADFANDRGLVINKSAEQATHEGIYKLMKDLDVDIIMVSSAVKSNSRHQHAEIKYDAKADKYVVSKKGETFFVKPEEIRITKTESEVKDKSFERIPWGAITQRGGSLFDANFNNAISDLIRAQPLGDPAYMNLVKIAEKQGIVNKEQELLINGKPLEIDKMDIYEIVNILNTKSNSPIWNATVKAIFKDKRLNVEPYEKMGATEIQDNMRTVQDILETFNYDSIVMSIGNNAKFVETTLRNYIATRISRPKVDYGMSYLRFKAADPMLLSKINLTNDNFYLHAGDKSKRIELENGNIVTLEKAFEMYQQAKKNNNKKLEKSLEDAMTMLIVRSPVGNPSGILSLRFGGFVDIPGRGIIVSKENANRGGGLDYDGDAAGVYQSVPTVVKQAFRNPKVAELLKNFDLTAERRELGFSKSVKKADWMKRSDIFNPDARRDQALEIIKISKMIGQVTNMNQMIREHLNYIIQNPDKAFMLDMDGTMVLTAKKEVKINGKRKKVTPEELLTIFEATDAPNILNLTLDGTKNSSNPEFYWLRNMMFTKYFNVQSVYTGLNQTIPMKLQKGYNQTTMKLDFGIDIPVYDVAALIRGRGDKLYKNEGATKNRDSQFEAIFESGLLEGQTVKILDVEMGKKYEKLKKDFERQNITKEQYEAGIKDLYIKDSFGEMPVFERFDSKGNLIIKDSKGNDILGLSGELKLENISYIQSPTLHPFRALKARQDWNAAIKGGRDENGNKTNVGKMSEIAEQFVDHYIKDRNTQEYYQDTLIDVARVYTEKNGLENLQIDMQPLNEANYPDLYINLLKAVHKVKDSPTMKHLIEKGMITEDLLSFVDNVNPKLLEAISKGESHSNIKKMFDIYTEMLNHKNSERGSGAFDPGRLPEQFAMMSSLLSLEVRLTQARDVLMRQGMSKTDVDAKVVQIIDAAYEIRVADFIKQQTAKEGISQTFDADVYINRYVNKMLREFGNLETGRKVLTDEVSIRVLEDIFYTSLLGGVVSGRGKVSAIFSEMQTALVGGKVTGAKKHRNFLRRYDLDLGKVDPENPVLNIAINSATEHYYRNALNMKEAIKQGKDPLEVLERAGSTKISSFIDHAGRIQQYQPNFLKLQSIPKQNKINFLQGVKDILETGMITNTSKVGIKIDIPYGADKGAYPRTQFNQQRVADNIKVEEVKIENGRRVTKDVGEIKNQKNIEDIIIAEDVQQAEFIKRVLKEVDLVDVDYVVQETIMREFEKMTQTEKIEFIEKNLDKDSPIKMYDLRNSVIKPEKGQVLITKEIAQEINKILDIIRENPSIAVNIEGIFAQFTSSVGITGAPVLGKTIQLSNLPEIRAFRRMIEDIYVSRKSWYQKMKDYGKKIGKDVFGKDYFNKPENVPTNAIDKVMHYIFQGNTGVAGRLRQKEMLTHYIENVPLIDKVDGEYIVTKRSMTVPTSTLELVRQQVDFGNTLASSFQDYFEDIIKESFKVLNVEDPAIKKEINLLVEAAVNKRIWDNGNYGGRTDRNVQKDTHYDAETRARFEESWNYSKKEIARMEKEHGLFKILNEQSTEGKTRDATPMEVVDLINNRITKFYDIFMKNVITPGQVEVSPGVYKLTKEAKDSVMTNGFLDYNKLNKKFKKLQMGKKSKVNLLDNLIGMNELLFYKYEYEILNTIETMKDPLTGELMFPEFNVKDPKTHTAAVKKEVAMLRKANQLEQVNLITRDGSSSPYWTFTNHMQYKKNQTNIDNWIANKMADITMRVQNMNEKTLPKEYRALHRAGVEGYKSLREVKERLINDMRDDLMITMQRFRNQDAGMSETMSQFIGRKRGKLPGGGLAGQFKSKGATAIPGFGKDLNVLTKYVKSTSKSYIDTLVGLRSSVLIDTFQKNNYLKDVEATTQWSNYMRDALNNMLGLNSSRSLELHGITKAEKDLLDIYIKNDLNIEATEKELGRKFKYTERYFLSEVESNIAPDSYWYTKVGEAMTGKKLRQAIYDYKMRGAKALNNVKNIDKINKSGTLYNMVTDHSATNFIRTQEERIGKIFGYKEGEFSIFGDLRMSKDPITGEMKKVSEQAKRIAIARKLKAFSEFEGKWELLSLLSHPKTSITNLLGGTQNIYADTGWKPFRDATNQSYLINEVFNGAKFEVKNPITGKIEKKSFKSMEDINTWLSQEGFLEGMYIEETGINKTFRDANMQKAAKAIVRRLFSKDNQKLMDTNPTEYAKERKASILEIAEKYGIEDAMVKFGSSFMSKTEIMLRRTAALSHYLNARQVLQPLMKELPYNSPMLMEIARRGIESSQFIYHSAFRTNYSNTSLGRVMTRFHPYAWNSIKRRRLIYKGARYTEWMSGTNSSQVFQRQLTADLMSMALAAVFTSTIFEYALSPPMSWLQDTSQWLFGDRQERERAFFSQWPGSAFAPLQVVTPPIARYVLPPINAVMSGDFDSFVDFQLYTYAPFGRLIRDTSRSFKNPSMTVDFMTGVPIHRIGQEVKRNRQHNEDKRLQEEMEENE